MKSFWRWTGTIFFALAFLFLVLTGIGTSLPIEHHAWCTATYNEPDWMLFATVVNDATTVKWRPEIASAVLISGRGPTAVWRETDSQGNAMTYRTAAYVEGHKIVRTIDYVPGVPFAGSWTYDFYSRPAIDLEPNFQTQLTITEDGKVYNPFFRFLARYVFGYTQTMRTYFTDLERPANENPTVTCVVTP